MLNPVDVVQSAREVFQKGRTRPIAFRKAQLKQLLNFIEDNEKAIGDAFYKDSKKQRFDALIEQCASANHVKYIISNFEKWTKVERPPKRLVEIFYGAEVHRDPYGVVLVMGAWNVPLLTLVPIAGAIAAGNAVVLKPSHNCPNFSDFIAKMLPNYLDSECYPVCVGGIEETNVLLDQRFDYIYYTGSFVVGKLVHRAANKYLTPTTLELGGKNPVYVDSTADLQTAVRRIIWGKFFNMGQTCLAPDYVLCTRDIGHKFVELARRTISEFFGDDPQCSPDLARIINSHHFWRLEGLLKQQKVAFGGKTDQSDNYIEPTLLIDVAPDDAIMQEEIFGPLLPIIAVENEERAAALINAKDKPLAVYVFSNDNNVRKYFVQNTSSGAVTINDTLLHLVIENLPFGGVGASGMGAYKGKYSFETFVHRKSVLVNSTFSPWEKVMNVRYPPFTPNKYNFIKFVMSYRWFDGCLNGCGYLVMFLFGILTCLLAVCLWQHFY